MVKEDFVIRLALELGLERWVGFRPKVPGVFCKRRTVQKDREAGMYDACAKGSS